MECFCNPNMDWLCTPCMRAAGAAEAHAEQVMAFYDEPDFY